MEVRVHQTSLLDIQRWVLGVWGLNYVGDTLTKDGFDSLQEAKISNIQ